MSGQGLLALFHWQQTFRHFPNIRTFLQGHGSPLEWWSPQQQRQSRPFISLPWRHWSIKSKADSQPGFFHRFLSGSRFPILLQFSLSLHVPQEENEIPASVYVKDPPPFPRDEILEECEELAPGTNGAQAQEGALKTIQLSSDEDVGLEADLEEDDIPLQDLENMERSRAEKLKLSSLKKVSSSVSQTVQMVQSSHRASVSRWTVWRKPSPGRTLRRRWRRSGQRLSPRSSVRRSNRKHPVWRFLLWPSASGRYWHLYPPPSTLPLQSSAGASPVKFT